MLNSLNSEQLAAVTLGHGNALVLAGAGSGKTRVLTSRIAWLLQNQKCRSSEILAVTFTNKAAREMSTRLDAMLPRSSRSMWVGTFHGLSHRFLRLHWEACGLEQNFQILDNQDQLSAIKRLLKTNNIDIDNFPPKKIQLFINYQKENGLRAEQINVTDQRDLAFVDLYKLYEQQCLRENVLDFAELLLRMSETLQNNETLRHHYQERFKYILVDEFQDTNTTQYQWLRLISGAHSSVMVVGDDDQSIYAFRGARVGNMMDFQKDYQVEHIIKLEQNYRSHGNILAIANQLIENNSARLGKSLRTNQGAGEPVQVVRHYTEEFEAKWITQSIKTLQQQGSKLSEIAILYRSNAQSRAIENQLFSHAIAYQVYGGLRFFERAEVKHVLAYLRLMVNLNDDTSFLRVANFPVRSIGERSLEQLGEIAKAEQSSLFDAVAKFSGRAGNALNAFCSLILKMREDCQKLNLPQVVSHTIVASGIQYHYETERDGKDRLDNLQELVNSATSFIKIELWSDEYEAFKPIEIASSEFSSTKVHVMTPLEGFLSHAALEAGDNLAQLGQDCVQMMTVHAAKGLEFDQVFVTGIEEGLFPHENSFYEKGGIEEERRLFYVAITRARKRLFLSFASKRMLHGNSRANIPSRFFDEIDSDAIQWVKAKETDDDYDQPPSFSASVATAYSARPLSSSNPIPSFPTSNKKQSQHIHSGLTVFHQKFGEGKVLQTSGEGNQTKALIHFNRHGSKWLALEIAKLTVIE